ncbi:hypothetical protein HYV69_03625 [Candidatus Uhrbacteria bacterium]|nr:hypothetical protein [Candidatus Uhrbacteria bacterium]
MIYFVRMEEQSFLREEEKEFKRFHRLSVFWVENQVFLRKIGYGIFIAFDGFLLLFVVWTMIDSFALSYDNENREVAQIVAYGQQDLHSYTIANSADSILQEDVRVFPIGNTRYDFYSMLENPNSDWWVEFNYQFMFDAGETVSEKGFLLPGQEKPVISLAITSQIPVQVAELKLTDIVWHRIDKKIISDYTTWQDDRLRIEVSDATFSKESGTTFAVFNNTAFSYFDPVFYVLLKRGPSVVGVSRATVASLKSGEHQEISLYWFGTLPSVGEVEVIPDIQLFNPDVYQRIEGEPSIDIRTKF